MQRSSAPADETSSYRRGADTLLEATLENAQVDNAMAAIGIAQNPEKEENVIVARGGRSKSVQTEVGQATCQEVLAASAKTTVRLLGWSFDCNAWHHGRAISSNNATFSRQLYKGSFGLMRFRRPWLKSHRE